MKLADIAERINVHLQRMEHDPVLNPNREFVDGEWRETGDPRRGTKRFYQSWSGPAGSRVRVTYVSYQGALMLRKEEAAAYLAWLDAGNNGTHHNMRSSAARRRS